MNKVILIGRLTRDPEVRYTQRNSTQDSIAIARFTLAVDRRFRKEGEDTADFISCVSFGKTAEFEEKYFRKGLKVAITGRIQTGSYTNKDGQKVYTTDVVVEEQEFAERKSSSQAQVSGQNGRPGGNSQTGGNAGSRMQVDDDGFMQIPDGIDEELPFS